MGIPRTIPPKLTKTEWNELIALLTGWTGSSFSTTTMATRLLNTYRYYGTGSMTLESVAPDMTNQEMVDALYGYTVGGVWIPGGLPTGSSPIIFKDTTSLNTGHWFGIRSNENFNNILLSTDVGVLVQKDVAAGGFLSSNQGAVLLGHGLLNVTDHPKILLVHSTTGHFLPTNSGSGGWDTLFIDKYNENGSTSVGNLEALNIAARGVLVTDIISGSTGGTTNFKSNIYPSGSTLTLGSNSFPWYLLNAWNVYTDLLNAHSGGTVNVASNLYPTGSTTLTLGSAAFPWYILDSNYVYTDFLNSLTGGTVNLASNLYPTGSTTLTLGSSAFPWYIVDSQYLYSNFLNALTGGTVNVASNLYPTGSTTLTLGSYNYPWYILDANYVFTDTLNGLTGSTILVPTNMHITGSLTVDGAFTAGTTGDLTVNGNLVVTGSTVSIHDTKLHRSSPGVLQVQTAAGALGTLDTSFLYADFLNSASGTAIGVYSPFTDNLCTAGVSGVTVNHFVSITGNNTLSMATRANSSGVFGVALNTTGSGGAVQAATFGRAQVIAGENLLAGDRVSCDDSSHAIKYTSHSHSSGSLALNAATGVQTGGPDSASNITVVTSTGTATVSLSTHSHVVASHSHGGSTGNSNPVTGGPDSTAVFATETHAHTVASHSHGGATGAANPATGGPDNNITVATETHEHTVALHSHSITGLTTSGPDSTVDVYDIYSQQVNVATGTHAHTNYGNTSQENPTTSGPNTPSTASVATNTHSHVVASHTHSVASENPATGGPNSTAAAATNTHAHTVASHSHSIASENPVTGGPDNNVVVLTAGGTAASSANTHYHILASHNHTFTAGGTTSIVTTGEVEYKVLVGATTGNLATIWIH